MGFIENITGTDQMHCSAGAYLRCTLVEVSVLKWEEVRNQYPDQWVLVEALEAESQNGKREILHMAIINQYNNSTDAWKGYKNLHLLNSSRELYIFHTSNEKIEVVEKKFTGIRRRYA